MLDEKSMLRAAPELLAPAGNWECIHAAIENGADAVYFGLDAGFNARARATNFLLDDLPELMRLLHRRNVLGYVTLNTLVFTDELPSFEKHVAAIATAGVDAVLIQDLGAVQLIHEVCPELSVHASTQMTMVSAETIRAIESLRVDRVVLARELSISEIRKITASTSMPVETFIHGALCVAYSGQCLTSESLGGRSANRGQCAQACRLNYDLICDGERRDLGDNRYLLSPQDLAGYEHIPQLIQAGVCSLKIEGRLKSPEYVANIVGHYRSAIDAAMLDQPLHWTDKSRREMELSFSRGFTPGWLEGCNHKRLVPGTSSAKRGVMVGRAIGLRGERLIAELDVPVSKGDGIVLQGDRIAGSEIGGRIFQIFQDHRCSDVPTSGKVEIALQNGILRNVTIPSGLPIWLTDAPQLTKRLRASFATEHFARRTPISLDFRIVVGEPLSLQVSWMAQNSHRKLVLSNPHVPEVARKHAITCDDLQKQFSRLGNTPYELAELKAQLSGQPMVPLSVLGELRKALIAALDSARTELPVRSLASDVANKLLNKTASMKSLKALEQQESVCLNVLVRSMSQLRQVLELKPSSVYVDFHDIREYRHAIDEARSAGIDIYIATLRIQKPGEYGLFRALAKHHATGWLVRNLAALDFARENAIQIISDFSLNVTNPLTASWLRERGAKRITPSYDLNRDQLTELVDAMPADWLEIVVHQHMPMFHMEHCVFCTVLSPGTNKSNCGRPCDRHDVKLRDRLGVEHVLHADVGCRNTLFNGTAQSGAEAIPRLLKSGVKHFRIELLRDAPKDETKRMVELYRDLLLGRVDASDVWKSLRAENRVGVTRGTLEYPRNPLAII